MSSAELCRWQPHPDLLVECRTLTANLFIVLLHRPLSYMMGFDWKMDSDVTLRVRFCSDVDPHGIDIPVIGLEGGSVHF